MLLHYIKYLVERMSVLETLNCALTNKLLAVLHYLKNILFSQLS